MLERFQDYFEAIEVPQPLIERAEQICGAFDRLIERPVNGVFICDFFEPEGARRFTSVFLCTPSHIVELKNFAIAVDVDFTRLSDAEYLDITRNDLVDLDRPLPSTVMQVELRFKSATYHSMLSAARNNCRFLRDFAATHLMPNIGMARRV